MSWCVRPWIELAPEYRFKRGGEWHPGETDLHSDSAHNTAGLIQTDCQPGTLVCLHPVEISLLPLFCLLETTYNQL